MATASNTPERTSAGETSPKQVYSASPKHRVGEFGPCHMTDWKKEVEIITPKANQPSALINAPIAKVPREPRDPIQQTLSSPS